MLRVTVLGAGELGATIAQKLAHRDWLGEILLIESASGPPQGKALDLLQSNPVIGSGTKITGSSDLAALEDSDFLVFAELGGLFEEDLDRAALEPVLKKIADSRRKPFVLVARNNPTRLMRFLQKSARVPAERIIGIGPIAVASLWRHHLGRELLCSPQDIQVSLLGAPPRAGLYECFASLSAHPIEELLTIGAWREVSRKVGNRSYAGPRALASAAARMLSDITMNEGAVHSCYVWTGGAYGARDLFLCAPAILGSDGVRKVLDLRLDPGRRVTVDRAIDHLTRLQVSV